MKLLKYRDEAAAIRYGEPRYVEAQRYLRLADDTLTPQRKLLEASIRTILGEVG